MSQGQPLRTQTGSPQTSVMDKEKALSFPEIMNRLQTGGSEQWLSILKYTD